MEKEFESLSEKECNILVNKIRPLGWNTEEEDRAIRLIFKTDEELTFKGGFFTKDVKDAVKRLKEVGSCGIKSNTIFILTKEELNKIFGPKLT